MKKRMPMKMIIPGYIISRFTGLLILFFASAAYADTYNYIWRLDDDGQSLVRQRTLYNGVKVNGDGSLSGLYANVNRLSTGYGEFIDDTDVEGTILDWCFSSSDNGYVITDKYTYLYDGSSLSVVEDHPTHGRIMKAELNSDRNYSFLYEDNTLSNTIWFFLADIDTSSIGDEGINDFAFFRVDDGSATEYMGYIFTDDNSYLLSSSGLDLVDSLVNANINADGQASTLDSDGMLYTGYYAMVFPVCFDTSSLIGRIVNWAVSSDDFVYIITDDSPVVEPVDPEPVTPTPTPEPASFLLLASGLLGLRLYRKKVK